jgi:hypothetical protein
VSCSRSDLGAISLFDSSKMAEKPEKMPPTRHQALQQRVRPIFFRFLSLFSNMKSYKSLYLIA